MLLNNLARIFEAEADKQLPPPPTELDNENNSGDHKNSYWKNFCGEVKNFKINFKNCLLVVGRSLVKLLCPVGNEDFGFISNMLKGISRVRQKIRAGRHSPRQSRKPINKWKSSSGIKVTYA